MPHTLCDPDLQIGGAVVAFRQRRPSDTVELDGFGVPAQQMAPLVDKPAHQVLTPFGAERIDESTGYEKSGLKASAVCLNSAGDIDGIAEDGEFKPVVAADITLQDLAVVDADGDLNRRIIGAFILRVATAERLEHIKRTMRRVGRIARAGYGRSEHSQ